MVYYFAQNATIQAKKPNGTYETVGAAQEVSFEMNFEDVKLYQFGSVKRADAARHSLAVPVTVKLASFGNPNDSSTGGDWFWAILNGFGWAQQTGQTGKRIEVNDSSSFPMFRIAGQFRPTDSSSSAVIYAEAQDVYFKSFQWGGGLGEYIMENLEGEGSTVVFTTTEPTGWNSDTTSLYVTSPTGSITCSAGSSVSVTLNKTTTNGPFLGTSDSTIATASWNTSTSKIDVTVPSGVQSGKEVYVFAAIGSETTSFKVTVGSSSNED